MAHAKTLVDHRTAEYFVLTAMKTLPGSCFRERVKRREFVIIFIFFSLLFFFLRCSRTMPPVVVYPLANTRLRQSGDSFASGVLLAPGSTPGTRRARRPSKPSPQRAWHDLRIFMAKSKPTNYRFFKLLETVKSPHRGRTRAGRGLRCFGGR